LFSGILQQPIGGYGSCAYNTRRIFKLRGIHGCTRLNPIFKNFKFVTHPPSYDEAVWREQSVEMQQVLPKTLSPSFGA
jgi:hypothetical protein